MGADHIMGLKYCGLERLLLGARPLREAPQRSRPFAPRQRTGFFKRICGGITNRFLG
jgi:hypothetical protein